MSYFVSVPLIMELLAVLALILAVVLSFQSYLHLRAISKHEHDLAAVGFLRLGTFIKFIPFPVTVGFTAGIAVIIFASQIKELFGLTLDHEAGELLEKLPALWEARASLTRAALLVSVATVAIILGLRRWRPRWPGMLIAVGVAARATALLNLPVQTIGTKFGGIPSTLPLSSLPPCPRTR